MKNVTCTLAGCPCAEVDFSVPDDGFPVTCGGCGTVIAE